MSSYFRSYLVAISWFILSLFISVMNDAITKMLATRLDIHEISFFRFAFSAMLLVPLIGYYGIGILKTQNIHVHFMRGVFLFLGMISWIFGLTLVPIAAASLISLSIPIFILILAVIFLKENVIWQRWFVTIAAFIGIMITLQIHKEDFNPQNLILVFAALMFASLDILNKKFISKESMINMLFYSSLFTAALSFPLALYNWMTPSSFEFGLFILLGIGANLILFCLLKAFRTLDASAVAPYRYLELIVSGVTGYILFGEAITKSTIYGAIIIIPATLFIIYSEKTQKTNI